MNKICDETADEVEEEVREVSEGIFHVVSENVEKEHVPAYMKNSAVEEDGRNERVKISSLDYFGWDHGEVVVKPVCKLI